MDRGPEILIVHDSAERAGKLQEVLQTGLKRAEIARVHSEEGVEAMLRKQPWDLIVYSCESFVAAETIIYFLRKFRPRTAMIAVTDTADMDLAVALMKMGVNNCVPWSNISGLPDTAVRELEMLQNRQPASSAISESASGTISELRNLQFFLCAILNQLPLLVWMKDLDNRYIMVNNTFVQYTGLTGPDRVVGKTDLEIWPADLATRYRLEDRKVHETLQPLTVDEEVQTGKVRKWVEVCKLPVFNDRRQLIGTAGFARDISGRREYEEALLYHSSLLNATLDTLSHGILLLDSEGHTVYANQACYAVWGISAAEHAEMNAGQIRELIAARLKKPDQFLALVMNSHKEPVTESVSLLEFEDGRIITCTAKPVCYSGQIFGRVLCFSPAAGN